MIMEDYAKATFGKCGSYASATKRFRSDVINTTNQKILVVFCGGVLLLFIIVKMDKALFPYLP